MAAPIGSHGETRRLSPLDSVFLYFERPNQLLHVGCVAMLEGSVPFETLVRTLEERLAGLWRYHQRPVRPLLDFDLPRWEDDPQYDLRHHVRHVAVPPPGGEAELRELVNTLFATPLDAQHPLWEMHLIDGLAGGRSALLCKTHHCMIDGVSGAQVLEVITDSAKERPGEPLAVSPSSLEKGAAQSSKAQLGRSSASEATPTVPGLGSRLRSIIGPSEIVARARETREALSTFASFVREPTTVLPFNGSISDRRSVVWASFALDDFLAIRGIAGCKVNDVVLAVIAGALHRYLEGNGYRTEGLQVRALVPVSMRGENDRLSLGNRVAAMFPTLPVGGADPVERLRLIATQMRELKERGQARASGFLISLAGLVPAPLTAMASYLVPEKPLVNTVCTNVPGPREVRYLAGRRVVEIHPIVPLFQGMGLEFAILSYAGRISIGAVADPHLVPDADQIPTALFESHAVLREALDLSASQALSAAQGRCPAPARGPLVADLMTREVVTLTANDSLALAYATMRRKRFRHLPVVDDAGRLVGIVTHRDLLAASTSSLEYPTEEERVELLGSFHAGEVMETHMSTAALNEPAAEAGRRMVRHKIGCLPVVESDGRMVGIVTAEDFLRWATDQMAAVAGPARAAAAAV